MFICEEVWSRRASLPFEMCKLEPAENKETYNLVYVQLFKLVLIISSQLVLIWHVYLVVIYKLL